MAQISHVDPDILILANIDYDHGHAALTELNAQLAETIAPYPHRFTARPNTGLSTPFDIDGDGRTGRPRDAQGYGLFSGDGGMAILSRKPILSDQIRDLSTILWKDLPDARLPQTGNQPFFSEDILNVQRVSTTAHWIIPIDAGPRTIELLVFHASPPVFDGPEDRNGLRNADEIRLWQLFLNGKLPEKPAHPVILSGVVNLDPVDGQGRKKAIHDLLAHPSLQDPEPRSDGGKAAADLDHRGDPALDTADWPDGDPGNLRVDYILPDRSLTVENAGIFWPDPLPPDLFGEDGQAAGPHRIVWVDLKLP
ncbi:endonuclease/exonuclease/phosphatase family protein [Aestuariibius insulae]|uniref:endonuclease/exonuclease/phosphatase family protein n=1 Tax=Aestuariibius insulae TaxID=2058287 RepID=UPI00345E5B4A